MFLPKKLLFIRKHPLSLTLSHEGRGNWLARNNRLSKNPMENAIIIINAEDIAAAEHLANGLDDYTVYVFDPVLIDRLARTSLKPVELIAWHAAPVYSEIFHKAHEISYVLEKELDAGRHGILPEISVYGWQHLNLYYLFMSLHWYSGLWNDLGLQFSGKKLHIFMCDNPAIFYFNSFIPSLLLLQFARQHEIEFCGYTYGEKNDVSDDLPDLRGVCSDDYREILLTHLPTCMYDMGYFNQEMHSTGKSIVNIEAKYFSMPVQAHTSIPLTAAVDLEQEISSDLRQRIDAFLSTVAAKLDTYFERSIATQTFRERQISQLVNTYRSQILSYFHLSRYFNAKNINKILLSDHDTGLHGPLLAFAELHHIPVLILPHSKTTPDLEFAYKNMHALVHPSQGEAILDRNLCRVPHFKLCIPTTLQTSTHFPNELKSVALMLNAYSLNGIYFANYQKYMAGIKRIAAFCAEKQIELRVRCKPSYSLIQLLVREAGLDINMLVESAKISMAEYSASCDVCIMYDTPTAGALDFLAKSIPIVNPILAPLTRPQAVTTHPHAIARETIEECLARIASFQADPSLLQEFKMKQFRTYLDLFDGAQPLRVFL